MRPTDLCQRRQPGIFGSNIISTTQQPTVCCPRLTESPQGGDVRYHQSQIWNSRRGKTLVTNPFFRKVGAESPYFKFRYYNHLLSLTEGSTIPDLTQFKCTPSGLGVTKSYTDTNLYPGNFYINSILLR